MKVVITLTTIPSRLNSNYPEDIRTCISSLLNQTFEDYEVHFNIPYKSNSTGEEYLIPEWLDKMVEENPKLKLILILSITSNVGIWLTLILLNF
jgi:hypothetical protein